MTTINSKINLDLKAEPVRCKWCTSSDIYKSYHDNEWGVPKKGVGGERELFELLCLEGQQAGLSWITILNKREGYRKQFFNFDYKRIAKMTDEEVKKAATNPDIIRYELKVNAIRKNALAYASLKKANPASPSPLSDLLWSFVGNKQKVNSFGPSDKLLATSPESDKMSAELKKLGFTFVGSTICYAYMQSAGLVWDHNTSCHLYKNHKEYKKL